MFSYNKTGTIRRKRNATSSSFPPSSSSLMALFHLLTIIITSSSSSYPVIRPNPSPTIPAHSDFRPAPNLEMPQCTDSLVLSSEINMERTSQDAENGEVRRANITSFVQLTTVTLGETLCMLITSNSSLEGDNIAQGTASWNSQSAEGPFSMLHTLEYVRLELHYGITGTYKFAIPAITPRCKCDCAGGETICNIEKYQYRNCSIPGMACYRTHKGGQSNTGCLSSGKADICCQVEVKPYREWTFQAIRLKQPSTVLVLRYRIFERHSEGRGGRQWVQSIDEKIAIPLNKGATKFELNRRNDGDRDDNDEQNNGDGGGHRVEISAAGGRPHRQMEPGMYFYKIEGAELDTNAGNRLRNGIALNGLGEGSLEKLGWFRWERGQGWMIRKGLEKITQSQHISVEDCKAQRYRATFNAEQFVLLGDSANARHLMATDAGVSSADLSEEMPVAGNADEMSNYDLGTLVVDEPWVGAVRMGEREVVLEHAEGVALALTLRTESQPRIVHHSSQFSEFTGTIVLDKESNRYLNLTFYNARGTLIGQIFTSPDSLSVMESIFSIDIGKLTVEQSQRVVATSVQSPRLVCFYPIGDLDGRRCHRLEFVRQPLQETPRLADQWQHGHSDCRGCNERGVDSFLASMDPRQWLNGLNTPAEMFTCLVELVLCVVLLLLALLLLTKCIIPLCRCVRFAAKPAKSKQNR